LEGKSQDTAIKKLLPHWEIMKKRDAEMFERTANWRVGITEDQTLPPKYKELMMVAMCCVIRFEAGIKVHSQYALDCGATIDELYAAIVQSMLIGGVPAYREGVMAVRDLFEE